MQWPYRKLEPDEYVGLEMFLGSLGSDRPVPERLEKILPSGLCSDINQMEDMYDCAAKMAFILGWHPLDVAGYALLPIESAPEYLRRGIKQKLLPKELDKVLADEVAQGWRAPFIGWYLKRPRERLR